MAEQNETDRLGRCGTVSRPGRHSATVRRPSHNIGSLLGSLRSPFVFCLALGALVSLMLLIDPVRPLSIDVALVQMIRSDSATAVAANSEPPRTFAALLDGDDYFGALLYAVSLPGDGPLWILGTVFVVVGYLLATGHSKAASVVGVLDLGGGMSNFLLKDLFERMRPDASIGPILTKASGYSFPSGHAVHYTVLFGFLAWWAWRCLPAGRTRTCWLIASTSMVLLVGPSRVYLGVHWPTDVIAGYLYGYLWLHLGLAVTAKRLIAAAPNLQAASA